VARISKPTVLPILRENQIDGVEPGFISNKCGGNDRMEDLAAF
jgi:hypothetical protein